MPHERSFIGVVEDDPVMGGTLVHRLELEGYHTVWWHTGQQALNGLRTSRPDLVVCDIRLPDISGEEIFFNVLPHLGGLPFLFVTAYGQIEQAVRLTKAGAVDYIAKPYALPDLLDRIPGLIAKRPGAMGVLGASQAMQQLELLLRRVADIDSVNCAAIPNELIESELFGHEKGAFTGAHARHHGFIERSRDGILFLDEVGELPTPVQVKLLRLLQDREYEGFIDLALRRVSLLRESRWWATRSWPSVWAAAGYWARGRVPGRERSRAGGRPGPEC